MISQFFIVQVVQINIIVDGHPLSDAFILPLLRVLDSAMELRLNVLRNLSILLRLTIL